MGENIFLAAYTGKFNTQVAMLCLTTTFQGSSTILSSRNYCLTVPILSISFVTLVCSKDHSSVISLSLFTCSSMVGLLYSSYSGDLQISSIAFFVSSLTTLSQLILEITLVIVSIASLVNIAFLNPSSSHLIAFT